MKKFFLSVAMLCFAAQMFGKGVDEATAMKAGQNFMRANANIKSVEKCELAYKLTSNRGTTSLYVFNINDNSFVVVAGDDIATPILGYSTNGKFDENNAPEALMGYLGGFDDEIVKAVNQKSVASDVVARQWTNVLNDGHIKGCDTDTVTIVEPLMNVFWNQGVPYNTLCPRDPDGPGGHVVTGCTSTAMAMLMRHWEFPTSGIGSHTYTPSGYPEQSVDFENAYYNYSLMDSVLTEDSEIQRIIEVARFMWHCGVSLSSTYGPDVTSAIPSRVPSIMKAHFKYAQSTHLENKSSYNAQQWMAMVRESLDAGEPLHYSGWNSSGGGGHSFICDGYQTNDLFHFNWGWGGSYDGFFALDAMLVANYDFSYNHIAVFDAVPALEYCVAPENIIAKVEGNDVHVQWNGAEYAQTYNVYRDGELIGNAQENSYWDLGLENGTYKYEVTTVCNFGESQNANFTFATINFQQLDGDANLDMTVDVADIVAIIYYMMNYDIEHFNFDNADVNKDGVINIHDIVSIVNIINN